MPKSRNISSHFLWLPSTYRKDIYTKFIELWGGVVNVIIGDRYPFAVRRKPMVIHHLSNRAGVNFSYLFVSERKPVYFAIEINQQEIVRMPIGGFIPAFDTQHGIDFPR